MAPSAEPLREVLTEYSMFPTTLSPRYDAPEGTVLSNRDLVIVMAISLTTASISILATMFAFYWFMRMRRSFRHDLIMLLIQSDMMKAIWLVVGPLAFFFKAPGNSNTTFCQVSGFFLTVSIEASDISVLLIAIHTSLFILYAPTSRASGLYPYRYVAYAFWAVVPILFAAMVPITSNHFANNGPHCYLPLRPLWYRRALSWIPRYIIFGFIITTYVFLYLYVSFRYQRFCRARRNANTSQEDHLQQAWRRTHHRHRSSVASSPLLVDHGLLSSVGNSLGKDRDQRERQCSVPSTLSNSDSADESSNPPPPLNYAQRNSIKWNTVDYSDGVEMQRRERQTDLGSPSLPSFRPLEEILVSSPRPSHCRSPSSPQQPTRSDSGWKRSMSSGSHSVKSTVSNVMRVFHPRWSRSEGTYQDPSMSFIYLSEQELEIVGRRSQVKVLYQLRLLFIYPAVYLLTWIAPFVSHIVRYSDEYMIPPSQAETPPLGLLCTSLACLSIGAAVDCCFFCLWEKPWRHLRGGFWEELALRLRIRKPVRHRSRGTGRTREEMFMDARMARTRRERENLNNEAVTSARKNSHPLGQLTTREWWDRLDVDSHNRS